MAIPLNVHPPVILPGEINPAYRPHCCWDPRYEHLWWGRAIFRVDDVDAHHRALEVQGFGQGPSAEQKRRLDLIVALDTALEVSSHSIRGASAAVRKLFKVERKSNYDAYWPVLTA